MRPLAPGVHQLLGRPPHMINAYLVEDVLVDAGTPAARKRLARGLDGRRLSAHVVTHAHPDHYGSSHAVCERYDVPLWAGQKDADAIETSTPVPAPGRIPKLMSRMKMPDAHPVARGLREGDEVAGFTVLEVPGHSPGHIALWRDHDGVLICGDVFFNLLWPSGPPDFLTWDREQNRASMRRLAELRPKLVLFGHGRPLRDPDRLRRLVG
ncbi:glyoxylase-like metal-dependent hydrolase (beta-lactamase superfamily II) [Saccharothrix tamanrassetensis]|uniref:Glyoxylase-like metal-dependent hydrolase (Beta-lactamase superfamily II) n=1 Tax=Saccharothrix tamanrassetensis TaxID=1051531 RepID=A0A841CHF6_9PSEU|nr:MBL fold metallo-hydrolase [Saccharothrix tamanrassetensis]MBB5956423.1 glyoxylase-like metal-dependent hydrolase (beta-lactamase superfamily II) [Saccharothrix tamanrassetensis]